MERLAEIKRLDEHLAQYINKYYFIDEQKSILHEWSKGILTPTILHRAFDEYFGGRKKFSRDAAVEYFFQKSAEGKIFLYTGVPEDFFIISGIDRVIPKTFDFRNLLLGYRIETDYNVSSPERYLLSDEHKKFLKDVTMADLYEYAYNNIYRDNIFITLIDSEKQYSLAII